MPILQDAANPNKDKKDKFDRMQQVYGTALPARLEIERQLLSRPGRLPGVGLPSSRIGLEAATGRLDTLDETGSIDACFFFWNPTLSALG